MIATIDNTTQMITALAEQHITEAIVNAAKGKTINKRTKKLSLLDEIKACFDVEKFLNNAAATIEELILRKVEEAVSAATIENAEKPKKKRAPTKKTVVTESEATDAEVTTEAPPSDEETKPKKKRAVAKKVTAEASVQASVEVEESFQAPVEVEASTVVDAEPTIEIEAPKPKKVRIKKVTVEPTVEPTVGVEVPKPKEKKARVSKKDKQVEVSDSDASDSEKPKKKRVAKKVTTPVLPVEMPETEAKSEEVLEPVEDMPDDSSVNTSDFIRPMSISNELEEEELSDIDEED